MLNELPESIVSMQVGDFIHGCEQGIAEVKYWAGKPFELNMPDQKVNEPPAQSEESKHNESSSDYKDALDNHQF